MYPKETEDIFLMKKRTYKILASIRPISSVMHKLPVILDTETGPNFLREDQFAPSQKLQARPVTTATRINDAKDEPFQIVA